MNPLRAWWLRRHGVCPVHLKALIYGYWGTDEWRSCDQCEQDAVDRKQKRVADLNRAAEQLAEAERKRRKSERS